MNGVPTREIDSVVPAAHGMDLKVRKRNRPFPDRLVRLRAKNDQHVPVVELRLRKPELIREVRAADAIVAIRIRSSGHSDQQEQYRTHGDVHAQIFMQLSSRERTPHL